MSAMRYCLLLLMTAALVTAGCQQDGKTVRADNKGTHEDMSREGDATREVARVDKETRTGAETRTLKMVAEEPGNGSMVVFLPAGKQGSAVKLTKSAPEQVMVGESFEYTIEVENQSDVALHDATLAAILPQKMDVSSTTPKAKMGGGQAVWNIDKIPAGASQKFIVTGKATETGQMEACSDMTFRLPTACLPIEVVQPSLKLVMEGPDEVLICEPIKYTAKITNTGSGPANNVSFAADLPDGLVFGQDGKKVTRELGTLAAGSTRTVQFDVDATKTGNMTVRGSADGDNDTTASGNASTRVRQPMLAVSVDMPKTRYVNTPMTAKVTVTNKGDGEARRTALTSTVPDNTRLTSASDKGEESGGRVSWMLGTIKPGDSRTVNVKLNAASKGDAELFASAAATCSKDSAKASTSIKGIAAILLECVDTTDPVAVGQNETYEIHVTNQGSADDTGIVITCTLPEKMEFVSASGPAKHSVKGRKVTFEPLKSLDPKKKVLYKVVTKGTDEGDLRFEVSLTSNQLTSPVTETESTHVYSDQ
jgi:uncharacterized repeat protein (TIGR01451 family)